MAVIKGTNSSKGSKPKPAPAPVVPKPPRVAQPRVTTSSRLPSPPVQRATTRSAPSLPTPRPAFKVYKTPNAKRQGVPVRRAINYVNRQVGATVLKPTKSRKAADIIVRGAGPKFRFMAQGTASQISWGRNSITNPSRSMEKTSWSDKPRWSYTSKVQVRIADPKGYSRDFAKNYAGYYGSRSKAKKAYADPTFGRRQGGQRTVHPKALVTVHELGHVLGLDHSFPKGQTRARSLMVGGTRFTPRDVKRITRTTKIGFTATQKAQARRRLSRVKF